MVELSLSHHYRRGQIINILLIMNYTKEQMTEYSEITIMSSKTFILPEIVQTKSLETKSVGTVISTSTKISSTLTSGKLDLAIFYLIAKLVSYIWDPSLKDKFCRFNFPSCICPKTRVKSANEDFQLFRQVLNLIIIFLPFFNVIVLMMLLYMVRNQSQQVAIWEPICASFKRLSTLDKSNESTLRYIMWASFVDSIPLVRCWLYIYEVTHIIMRQFRR